MRRWPNAIMPLGEQIDRARGGYQRVARRLLPKSPAADLIRLDVYNPRRALSRRRLARLIDSRRVIS